MAVIEGSKFAKRLIAKQLPFGYSGMISMLRRNFEHPKVLTVEVTVGQWRVAFGIGR